ncbi:ABC transporter ATP-binding protein [Algihabitans albus]|uniref:ABC transporter ATP-binding protein n=1 Tax=Algihabitans albus TaxID=2164067 RepID=UPI000E5D019A|nr:ABC transporter ATP-binding protein [Algihabitans albus]
MRQSLALNGLGKRYGEATALHPTDLTIESGEFLTLLGPSGSGKTTLLMMIAGFVPPSCGHMLLDGRDITLTAPEHRNFGVVFQGYALFPHLTVWDNVYFPLRARNIGRKVAAAEVSDALDLMELGPYARRMPKELSGGQQQRVALARALVFKPELLLLDEPLSALDKALRKTLQTELKALHRRVGTTFVYVTHDQEEALSMSDRIAILRDGSIQQIDAPDALYWQPRTPFVAGFLGRSNFLKGDIVDRTGGRATLRTLLGPIVADAAGASAVTVPAASGSVCLAIRPERLSVSKAEPAHENRVRGRVADLTFLGTHLEIEVEVPGLTLGAVVPAASSGPDSLGNLQRGSEIWLGWPPSAVLLLPDDGSVV